MLEFAGILAAAYLIGGVPFGYLVARRRGVDILAQGSGNIGATNVGRVLGLRFGVLVFFLDFAKGALPVALAMLLQKYYPVEPGDLLREDLLRHGLVEVGAGLLAFLGHLLPVYLGFRGGKGVATGAGVVAVLMPLPAILAMGVWVLLTVATRYISLASISFSYRAFGQSACHEFCRCERSAQLVLRAGRGTGPGPAPFERGAIVARHGKPFACLGETGSAGPVAARPGGGVVVWRQLVF